MALCSKPYHDARSSARSTLSPSVDITTVPPIHITPVHGELFAHLRRARYSMPPPPMSFMCGDARCWRHVPRRVHNEMSFSAADCWRYTPTGSRRAGWYQRAIMSMPPYTRRAPPTIVFSERVSGLPPMSARCRFSLGIVIVDAGHPSEDATEQRRRRRLRSACFIHHARRSFSRYRQVWQKNIIIHAVARAP